MNLLRKYSPLLVAMLVVALVITSVAGCSPNKNNAATRNYQAFITRYNIYYNGDKHYKETLKEMESKYEDDYSQDVYIHPVEAKNDPKAPQPSGDFNRSIEKAQKAIQVRSIKKRPKRKSGRKASTPEYKAWLKRDEYNPFMHNAWLMMGRSQYYNGDFAGAAATFMYISKHFTWLPETVTESQLWEARSYISMDWLFEGEVILKRIKPERLVNKTLNSLYNLTYADYHIHLKQYSEAVPYLQKAIGLASGAQKNRLQFLLGQLYAHCGNKAAAYQAFKKAGGAANASYRTKFNARIKQSEVYSGRDITPEVNALRRMTRYDRNKDYLDQIYYAIGNLYLSRGDTVSAIENYVKAAEKSTRNGIDKAINQITLGGLYYDRHQYDKAQPCYAEALPMLPESYPDYKTLKRRSDVLDELAVYSGNVTLQDSLLKLSYMTHDEQLAIVNRIIDELKKREKEEAEAAKREEYLAEQAANGSNLIDKNAPQQFSLNSDNSWYFYNTATRNAGKTEFQKRWGSRKLENDWRRRNKAAFSFDDFTSTDSEEESADDDETEEQETGGEELSKEEQEAADHASDPHYPEYYLNQIPKTDDERTVANDVIQEGLYNMGVILKDKMEDFDAASDEFNALLSRYPDNVYRLDTYYNLYLMAVRRGDASTAERYRQLIISEFPESSYGVAMQDPGYFDKLREMDSAQEALYDRALQDYFENRNNLVHSAYREMQREYPLSDIMPKFMFIDALAYVTENKPEEFKATLTEMLERYPSTDLSPYASAYLKGLNQGRKLRSGGTNMRGMLWDIRLTNDSVAGAGDGQAAEFKLDPTTDQLLILLFPTDRVSSNQLLYDVARHNFTSFKIRDFDLEQMNFGRLGLLIIKGFANRDELDRYRDILSDNNGVSLPEEVRTVVISQADFDTLLKDGRSFEEYFDYVRQHNYEALEDDVFNGQWPENPAELPEPAPESAPDSEPAPDVQTEEQDLTVPSDGSGRSEEPEKSDMPEQSDESTPAKSVPVSVPKPVSEPEPEPEKPAKPEPKPEPKLELPDYPVGSEGDDPLFDNP